MATPVEIPHSGAPTLLVGSSVRIPSGPFAGRIGVLSELGGDGTALVAITLVGENIILRIRAKDLSF